MTTSQLRVREVGRRHHDFGREQPAWESSVGEGCWRQQLSTGFYPLGPFDSFYGMRVIMPQIVLLGVIFVVLQVERVSVIPHSACTFELDECRTFYLGMRKACSLLATAVQLGQDVTWVDQEIPGQY